MNRLFKLMRTVAKYLLSIVLFSVSIIIIVRILVYFSISFTNVIFGAVVSQFIILLTIAYYIQDN